MLALIQKEVPQARGLGLFLQLFHDGHDDPRIALVAGFLHLRVIGFFGGIDVLVHKITNALHPFLLPGRIIEIHEISSKQGLWCELPPSGFDSDGPIVDRPAPASPALIRPHWPICHGRDAAMWAHVWFDSGPGARQSKPCCSGLAYFYFSRGLPASPLTGGRCMYSTNPSARRGTGAFTKRLIGPRAATGWRFHPPLIFFRRPFWHGAGQTRFGRMCRRPRWHFWPRWPLVRRSCIA